MKAHYVRVWLVVIIIVTIAVLATGCGSMYMVEKTTTIHYNKDSTKTITIVEKKKPVKKNQSKPGRGPAKFRRNLSVTPLRCTTAGSLLTFLLMRPWSVIA